MSSGERPIGAAKGEQSDTEALCQPPPPPLAPPLPWTAPRKCNSVSDECQTSEYRLSPVPCDRAWPVVHEPTPRVASQEPGPAAPLASAAHGNILLSVPPEYLCSMLTHLAHSRDVLIDKLDLHPHGDGVVATVDFIPQPSHAPPPPPWLPSPRAATLLDPGATGKDVTPPGLRSPGVTPSRRSSGLARPHATGPEGSAPEGARGASHSRTGALDRGIIIEIPEHTSQGTADPSV